MPPKSADKGTGAGASSSASRARSPSPEQEHVPDDSTLGGHSSSRRGRLTHGDPAAGRRPGRRQSPRSRSRSDKFIQYAQAFQESSKRGKHDDSPMEPFLDTRRQFILSVFDDHEVTEITCSQGGVEWHKARICFITSTGAHGIIDRDASVYTSDEEALLADDIGLNLTYPMELCVFGFTVRQRQAELFTVVQSVAFPCVRRSRERQRSPAGIGSTPVHASVRLKRRNQQFQRVSHRGKKGERDQ
ncbi:hypothetical protein THAOC_28258 [Thalassiosira oceanica]|uniref:Uncharacterized protein n=1 Tax=Thalassiosira oceanica TaxID=159749 RepID=K0RU97_THAOC|nr:hypothetical protein THAOC_28258 [Thalassiosira oceanica]|eukprot:EJK52461.1 hypothetical protein THAOC_28258 [Thalassiosira oceanica]